ncbi:2Fe-2S iron-sulfur cluster-binding protein [Ideonella oryzae]|uniref:2Fe-2S iron-sulfur cluster-binding protein n=1 Tax=Ideonella oryzae TaxID=2937441 RepID=A0ABT1BPR3_9BURK|nr:2Fe-2S iron-sulfur cluster-binding protein [Ideonella oryzae]MCO5977804.1 2Fe-2S iron-sulfur cluster-binding protein [Ideonella oryzae]
MTVSLNGGEACFEVAEGDTLLRAALRAGVALPYECGVGACGCCRCEVEQGQVEVLWAEAPGLSERDRRKGRQLACQCRPQGDVALKMRLDPRGTAPTPPRRQTATLRAVRPLTHDLREFVFQTETPAAFEPGQYAFLGLPGLARERAYSMANLANAAGEWHFCVRRVPGGEASQSLFDTLRPGDSVALDGPYGMAWLRPDVVRDIVCIAGGSGLAPMLSVARGAAATLLREGPRRLDFFYGGRTPADLCGRAELAALGVPGERLRYHAAVSDAQAAATAGWTGAVGPIHALVEQTLGETLAEREIYLAGPPGMVEALLPLLQVTHRIPPERIHFDRFF